MKRGTIWSDSPEVDVFLFVLPVLFVPVPYFISVNEGVGVLLFAAVIKFAFDLPHLASSWTRTVFDPSFRKDHPYQIFLALPLILVGTFFLGAKGRLDFLIAGLFYLAIPHGFLQVANLLACYRRQAEEKDSRQAAAETASLLLFPTSFLLQRLSGPLSKEILGIEIPYEWAAPWMAQAVFAMAGISLLTACSFEFRRVRAKGVVNLSKWMFFASVVLGYWLLSKIPSLELATLGYLAWHATQYLALTYRINRKRFFDLKRESPLLGSLFRPNHWGFFGLALLFHGLLVYLAMAALPRFTPELPQARLVWAVAVLYALSFCHFFLDVTLLLSPRYALVRPQERPAAPFAVRAA
ncbi:MAG: hypothetical protein AB1405_06355 [Bdellovibrionota bacterium]